VSQEKSQCDTFSDTMISQTHFENKVSEFVEKVSDE